MTILEYFNEAQKLSDGDTLLIPCSNEREQNTVRVMLYKIRKRFKAVDLVISKESVDGLPYVAVKRSLNTGAFILKQDGQVVPIQAKVEDGTREDKLSRIINFAIQDGMELSEIQEQLGSIYTPDEVEAEYNRLINL